MIDQFAAAQTLLLCLEARPERFGLVRKEFRLKRPGRFRARYEFNDKEGERICDGETMWMISRTEKQYSRMPVAAGETSKLGLLPDLFRDARQIAAGEDEYAQILAQARRTEAAAVGEELCDVVEISLDQPSGTKALVWLTQARRLPLRVRMISATGVIDYEVRTLEIGAALDDATFTFTPGPDWSGLEQVSPRPATPQPPGAGVSESELRKRDALRAVFEKSTGAREQPATDAKEQNDEH
ncbi:MAG: outer membrane lipoprotein carrier protein LolA [Phycisphaerae bacterium]